MTLREGSYNRQILLANKLSSDSYEPLAIPYVIEHHYKPDFVLPTGLVVEGKGIFRNNDKKKLLAIQSLGIDVKVLLQKANVRVPSARHTHEEWLEKNHFTYAVGTLIPPHWYTCPKNATNLEILQRLGLISTGEC